MKMFYLKRAEVSGEVTAGLVKPYRRREGGGDLQGGAATREGQGARTGNEEDAQGLPVTAKERLAASSFHPRLGNQCLISRVPVLRLIAPQANVWPHRCSASFSMRSSPVV